MTLLILRMIYFSAALLLAFFTLGQALLLWQYLRHRSRPFEAPQDVPDWPHVTVQLPLYNEQYVGPRLLNAVAQLDYPADRLHIHVLDDSDDRTSIIIANQCEMLREAGIDAQQIRREARVGFKAGALSHAIHLTDSPFIVIFDADFVPPPDFLRRTLPHFTNDPRLGILQTRWGHLNAETGSLPRAQRLAVDVHFGIEQIARDRAGWLLSFNGSGGVWRRECIIDAGGWSDDTLTEDLDLSYRAQLRGWQTRYLPDMVVPGELPPQLAAYKQQQARWAMGSTQCLRKLAQPLLRSRLSPLTKAMALHHLCQYLPQMLMLLLFLLTPPLLLLGAFQSLSLASLGVFSLIPPLLFIVNQLSPGEGGWRALMAFPVLLLLHIGLLWHNVQAVLRALRGQRGVFKRTPKFAMGWQNSAYALRLNRSLVADVLLLAYALWGLLLAIDTRTTALIPYLVLHVLAFALLLLWQLYDHLSLQSQAWKRQPAPMEITAQSQPPQS